jgi:hypothetical protein
MSEGSFEAVKVSYRQTKDGMVVAFAIHPNDAPGDLATLKLGTRLMIGWAEIKDDDMAGADRPSNPADNLGSDSSPAIKPAPATKRERTPAERAAFLCTLPEFQQWAWTQKGRWDWTGATETEACADWLRRKCGVTSRAQITTDPSAHEAFKQIEDAFHRRNEPPVVSEAERYA